MRPVTVLLLMLVPLLVLIPTVRIAYAQPIVKTGSTDPGPTSAHLSAEVNPNGHDTWWLILMHDEETANSWVPVGCTGESSADAGPKEVDCWATGLTMDHGYGDMVMACWAPFVFNNGLPDLTNPPCNSSESYADGFEVSWWTPLPANYATTTTTSASSIQSYTMMTNVFTVLSPSITSQPIMTNILTIFSASTSKTPGAFDFVLLVSPSTVSVVQGGTAHYTANVMYSDPSYAGTMINIQLTGLGPGMDYNLLQSGGLTVITSSMTPPGSYSIALTGSANGVTHQTGLTLIVTNAQPATAAVITTTVPSTTLAITTSAVITTPTVAVTSVITQTATIQPSPTSTQASTTDVMSLLQQNSLLIIAILVIALAALLLSSLRRSTGQAPQTQQQPTNVTYCSHCGTQNPLTNSYCRKCGTKLLNTTD